jgi:hypothetical protein
MFYSCTISTCGVRNYFNFVHARGKNQVNYEHDVLFAELRLKYMENSGSNNKNSFRKVTRKVN